MPQSILVTGGAGYIGSHACKALAQAGYTPVTYDNLSRGHRHAVRWGPLVQGDVGDRATVVAALKAHDIAAVMHFAAFAYVGESGADPALYYRNNVIGTLTLLDALREVGVGRIVFSSTCATYGLPEVMPIAETTPQRPVNSYGETKLTIERALYWYSQAYGLRSVALRYFNAAGCDRAGEIGEEHDPETHLIPLVLRAALGSGPPVSILGTDYPTPDGTAVRDYIHVEDLASAHVLALEYLADGGASTALNLATGQGYSVREIIAAVARAVGHGVPQREAPRRAGDPPALVADPSLARATLGWRTQCSDLDTIIGSALAWERRRHNTPQPTGNHPGN
jgi:UDP-arabinose 4-epimerase